MCKHGEMPYPMLNHYLIAIAALCLLMLDAAHATAAPKTISTQSTHERKPSSLLRQTAGDTCLRLRRGRTGDTLVNNCGFCVSVGVVRERGRGLVPDSRKFHVPGKSKFSLPFKGPGVTRIKSRAACTGEAGTGSSLEQELGRTAATRQKCLSFVSTGGSLALQNHCGKCRVVSIERYGANQVSLGREFMAIGPNARQAVPARGAAQAGVVSEVDCPFAVRRNLRRR